MPAGCSDGMKLCLTKSFILIALGPPAELQKGLLEGSVCLSHCAASLEHHHTRIGPSLPHTTLSRTHRGTNWSQFAPVHTKTLHPPRCQRVFPSPECLQSSVLQRPGVNPRQGCGSQPFPNPLVQDERGRPRSGQSSSTALSELSWFPPLVPLPSSFHLLAFQEGEEKEEGQGNFDG